MQDLLEKLLQQIDAVMADYSQEMRGERRYAVEHLRLVIKGAVQQHWPKSGQKNILPGPSKEA